MPRSESGRTVPRSHARDRVVGRGLCRLAVNSGVPPVLDTGCSSPPARRNAYSRFANRLWTLWIWDQLSLCDILARAPSMAIQDIQVDSLVIGAGPAGSAAAIQLAKAGLSVALVDRLAFPRDKVCGDALIPDALRALDELCLKDRVLEKARVLEKIRVYAPNERFIVIPGECACVPRETLDDIIRREAVYRGAQFYAGFNLHAALRLSLIHISEPTRPY